MITIRNLWIAAVVLAMALLGFLVVPAKAQETELQFHITPYVLPCGQGSTLLGLLPCGPDSQQGIFVHVRSDSTNFASYSVTVRYRTAAGERKTATETEPRKDGWTTVAFVIGRVKTPYLPDGVVVDGVDVVKQQPAVSFTVGEGYFADAGSDPRSTVNRRLTGWSTSECSGNCYVDAMKVMLK